MAGPRPAPTNVRAQQTSKLISSGLNDASTHTERTQTIRRDQARGRNIENSILVFNTDCTTINTSSLFHTPPTLSTFSKVNSRSLHSEAGGAGGASGTGAAIPGGRGGSAIPSGPTPVGMPSELNGLEFGKDNHRRQPSWLNGVSFGGS